MKFYECTVYSYRKSEVLTHLRKQNLLVDCCLELKIAVSFSICGSGHSFDIELITFHFVMI